MKAKADLKTCSRGHRFAKTKQQPVCPVCWQGFYKKKENGEASGRKSEDPGREKG